MAGRGAGPALVGGVTVAWQGRVVQKLAFARWHIEWAVRPSASAQQQIALLESALCHLHGAYRAFLAEILAEHQLSPDLAHAGATAQGICAGCPGPPPPALLRCADLERRESWLADLLGWYARMGDRPEGLVQQRRTGAAIIADSNAAAGPGPTELARCLDKLEHWVHQLRGDMQEW